MTSTLKHSLRCSQGLRRTAELPHRHSRQWPLEARFANKHSLPFAAHGKALCLQHGLALHGGTRMCHWQPGQCGGADLSVGMESPVPGRVSPRAGATGEVVALTTNATKKTAIGSHLWAAFSPTPFPDSCRHLPQICGLWAHLTCGCQRPDEVTGGQVASERKKQSVCLKLCSQPRIRVDRMPADLALKNQNFEGQVS